VLNSTYELKDLISRLARLICQILNVRYCKIVLLDPAKKYSILTCLISDRKKYTIDKKIKVSNRTEKRIIKKPRGQTSCPPYSAAGNGW
jgi:hypothetical protein